MRRTAMAAWVLVLAGLACSSPNQGFDDGFGGDDDTGTPADGAPRGDASPGADSSVLTGKDTGANPVEAGTDAASGEEGSTTDACLPTAEGSNECTASEGGDGAIDASADNDVTDAALTESGDEVPPDDAGSGPADTGADAPATDAGGAGTDAGGSGTDAGSEGGPGGCAPGARVVTMTARSNSGYFGTTGSVCVIFKGNVAGWNASNVEGRTVVASGSTTQAPKITDVALGNQPGLMPGPSGFIYWSYTGGTDAVSFASMTLF
jgi:hypothetical protein